MIREANNFTYISWPRSLVPYIVCWKQEGSQPFYFYWDLKPFWLVGNDIMVLRNKVWGWEEIEETWGMLTFLFCWSVNRKANNFTLISWSDSIFPHVSASSEKDWSLRRNWENWRNPLVNMGFLPICKLIFFTFYQIQYGLGWDTLLCWHTS